MGTTTTPAPRAIQTPESKVRSKAEEKAIRAASIAQRAATLIGLTFNGPGLRTNLTCWLKVGEEGIEIYKFSPFTPFGRGLRGPPLIKTPWPSVRNIEVDDSTGVRSRIEKHRYGLFGGLFKKMPVERTSTHRNSYVAVDCEQGQYLLQIDGEDPRKLEGKFLQWKSQWSSPAEPASQDDPLEQLQKLGELRDSGVLTDAEFEEKKAEILRRV